MIAYLKGTLLQKRNQQIILVTQGVGYLVQINTVCLERLPKEGNEIEFFIYTAVRDDAIALYGFEREQELQFFQKLIQVSGVGAKTALAILNHPIDETINAILSENEAYLTSVPGIGKKLAGRIILELKNKLEISLPSIPSSSTPQNHVFEEAINALMNLGYERPHVLQFIREQGLSVKTAEELIAGFLRSM